jgi:PKD repeat protein
MKSIYVAALALLMVALMPVSAVVGQALKPTKVIKAAYFDVTKPLRDITPIEPGLRDRSWKNDVIENKFDENEEVNNNFPYDGPDNALQTIYGTRAADPTIINNFEGVNNLSGVAPPDTDGDVGLNHYMQMVNLAFAIYDKEGAIVYGPADNSTIWDGFIGPWTGTNDGDPIVLYDEQADRWLASQFALPNGGGNGPWYELVAISATSDPTGEWYRYAFEFDRFPDYPKFGIWPDGYYFTIRQFSPWDGIGVCVADRAAMLAGEPDAELVFFDMSNGYDGFLPADADGEMAPPEGAPGIILGMTSSSTLRMWEVDIDWDNPNNSTLQAVQSFPVTSFNTNNIVVRQPGTSQRLDVLPQFLKFRVQYRNFGDHESLLACHDVNVGAGRAGIRWYEFRKEDDSWSVYQEGTYAPDDDESRWMGSIAMNENGDIALGYSVSSSTVYPSIRIVGQTAGAPEGLGVMDISETEILTGSSSQTGINRWGDYSSMRVDPYDDNTFWYTTEYSSGGWSWRTRIASFGFAAQPETDFSSNEIIIPVGEDVNFEDLTAGIPTAWDWSFEGGEPETSEEKNPSEIYYNTEGSYDVKLVSWNDIGIDSIMKEDYITSSSTILPDVDFAASEDFVCLSQEVTLMDKTAHVPIQWLWEFDPPTVSFLGETSETSQHPIVMFDEAAVYSVTLTAWNLNGESSSSKEDYITAGGYIPYFKETFEGNSFKDAMWTVENPDADVTWELFETGGSTPGTIAAGIDLSNYQKIGELDRIISPPFNLTGMSNAVLEFQHAYSQKHDGFSDSLIVYVSSDCNQEWVRIYAGGEDGTGSFATQEPMDDFWPQTAADWCMAGWGASCIALELGDYAGKSGVRFAFESYSWFGNPMFIDNVTVTQFVGEEENMISDAEVMIYPNPTNGTFNIELPENAEFADVNIVNYLGQSVYSAPLTEAERKISINPEANWTKGVYFVRLTGNGQSVTKKIILN